MAHLSVCLLGAFEVTLDGESVTGFESDRVRALLAYLTVEADRPHRRDMLAGLLWSEWPDQVARTNLRNALTNLRHAIGDDLGNLVLRNQVVYRPVGVTFLRP